MMMMPGNDNSNLLHLIDWILSKAINRVECARRVAQTQAHVACIHYIAILSFHHSDRAQPNLKCTRVTHIMYIISMTEETDGWLRIWVKPAIILIIQFSKHCRHVLEQRRSRRMKKIKLNSPLQILDILPNSDLGSAKHRHFFPAIIEGEGQSGCFIIGTAREFKTVWKQTEIKAIKIHQSSRSRFICYSRSFFFDPLQSMLFSIISPKVKRISINFH